MRDEAALGRAGRAGGVDDVGRVVGFAAHVQVGVGARGEGLDHDRVQAQRGNVPRERRVHHGHPRLRVLDHERDAVPWVGGIQGEVGGTGFQDPEDAQHGVCRPFDVQAHEIAPRHATIAQVVGKAVRPPIELGV